MPWHFTVSTALYILPDRDSYLSFLLPLPLLHTDNASTATEKELAYYVSGNVLEPVNCDYLFSELVNPIFIKDGEQVKVSVSVKYLDQRTKATQISQFDLTLEKDSNWKIVG